MERTSIIYRTRRKLQVLAHHILPDTTLSKIYYRIYLKKKLDFSNPRTFNEKLQWMKLYYYPQNPTVIQCADKYAVRDYIKKKGFADKLVPLIGAWDCSDEIDFSSLPRQFVLKCNHGCAYNIVCTEKDLLDWKKTKRQLDTWLREDFGAYNLELHYSQIKRHKIVCEQYLGSDLIDYKFFCFHGKPEFIYVSTDLIHDRQAQIGFFYLDGSKMPLTREDYTDIPCVELPSFFNEMKAMAENLAEDFPFVRVDFFVVNQNYYFAELTFTPSACMMPFNPERFDAEWGDKIHLEEVMKKQVVK